MKVAACIGGWVNVPVGERGLTSVVDREGVVVNPDHHERELGVGVEG